MLAAIHRVTTICCARIVIVAIRKRRCLTLTLFTRLTCSAWIPIITGSVPSSMLTPNIRIAGIDGAGVGIVTSQGLSGDTIASKAEIRDCAD